MGAGWLLALLLTMWARADSVLVVTTDRPVIVVVNMKPYPTEAGEVRVDFAKGREGSQNVRIRNLLGEQKWAGKVDLPADTSVTLRWELQNMNVGEPEAIAKEPPKLSDHGYRVVDGKVVGGPAQRAPGADRGVGHEPPSPRPAPAEDPFLAVLEQAEGSGSDASPAPEPPDGEGTDATEPPATPASTVVVPAGMGNVRFSNRNTSWTNLYVDGDLHELRGERELLLTLTPGPHEVRINDFRDKETWWSGEVIVTAAQQVELQFSKAAPPVALGSPSAWKAQP